MIDAASVLAALGRVSGANIAIAVGLLAMAFAVKIMRWRLMLLPLGADPGPRVHAATFLGGIALNNLLPLRAGDIARVVAFQPLLGAPHGALIGVLVLERVLDLLLLLALLAMLALTMPIGMLPPALSGPLAVMVVAAACAGLAVLAFAAPLAMLVGSLVRRVERPLARRVLRLGLGALETIAAQTGGGRLVRLVGLTALAWLLEGGLYVVAAQALHIATPLQAGYFAFALATLSTLIPSSPGYFGTFHVFAMIAAQAFGASASDAAAFAIVTHMLHWLPVTLAGIAALLGLSLHAGAQIEPGAR